MYFMWSFKYFAPHLKMFHWDRLKNPRFRELFRFSMNYKSPEFDTIKFYLRFYENSLIWFKFLTKKANKPKRKWGSNRDKIEHTELLIYTLEIPITTKLGSINWEKCIAGCQATFLSKTLACPIALTSARNIY